MNTTLSIIYGLIDWFTSLFVGLSLNTRSFVLNITLSSTFYISTFLLLLSVCLFIFFWVFFNTTTVSFWIFFILSANFIANYRRELRIGVDIRRREKMKKAINGDILVEYTLLLIVNSADASYSGQFFCLWSMKNQRYCCNS